MHPVKVKKKSKRRRKKSRRSKKKSNPPPLPPRPEGELFEVDEVGQRLEGELENMIHEQNQYRHSKKLLSPKSKKRRRKVLLDDLDSSVLKDEITKLEAEIDTQKEIIKFYKTETNKYKSKHEDLQRTAQHLETENANLKTETDIAKVKEKYETQINNLKQNLRQKYYTNTEKLLSQIADLKNRSKNTLSKATQTTERTDIKFFYQENNADSRKTYKDSYRDRINRMREKSDVKVENKEKRKSTGILGKLFNKFPKRSASQEFEDVSDIEDEGEIVEEEDVKEEVKEMSMDEEKVNMKFKIKKLEKYINTLENEKRIFNVDYNNMRRDIDDLKKKHMDEMNSLKKTIIKVEKMGNSDNSKIAKMIEDVLNLQKEKGGSMKTELAKLKEEHIEKTIRIKHEIENLKMDKEEEDEDEGEDENSSEEEVEVELTPEQEEELKKETEKKHKKIENILLEFLSSEETYVADLVRLEENFVAPLKKVGSNGVAILPSSHEIFKYLGQILLIKNINMMFLTNLKKTIIVGKSNISALGAFSQLIFDFSHTFKLYSDYVSNYSKFQDVVIMLKNNDEEFWNFIVEKQNKLKNEKVRMYEFQSLLITPVQRIPRYQLFMKDLVKNTSKLTKEYLVLEKAHNTIQSIATFHNDKTKQRRNLQRIVELQAMFGFENFILPHRQILDERKVIRITKNGNKLDSQLVLLTDLLLVYSLAKKKSKKRKPYVINLLDEKETKVFQFDEEMYIKYKSEYRKKDKKVRLEFENKNDCNGCFESIQNRLKAKRVNVHNKVPIKKKSKSFMGSKSELEKKGKRKSKRNSFFAASRTDYSDYDFSKL